MDDTLTLDKKPLKQIPPIFSLLFILLFGLPAIAIYYFSVDFSAGNASGHVYTVTTQIQTYFIQVLLQWTSFSLSAITALLAFIQYRLTNNKIALIIGLSVLFSGLVEGLHTFILSTPPYTSDKENIDGMIWTLTNTVSGIIFILGFLILLRHNNPRLSRWPTFMLSNFLLIALAFVCIYYTAFVFHQPSILFEDVYIVRPYELIYLSIYLIIVLFIYPRAYKKYPTLLTNCIFYMSVTQIIIAIYLMLLSNIPYESVYNIAYFLKIFVYFIPLSCLIVNYIFSYNSILTSQESLQKSQEKLKYFATRDPLTDLYNRREFENLLDISIANNFRSHGSFALFLIDIDNFKAINDTLGHIHGDHFLKQFSAQLLALTRKGDIISRIGGDEFTIITPALKSPALVKKLGERLVDGLNIPYAVDGKLLTGTVSVGVAIYPIDGDHTEELLKNADIAMYNAKRSGKNTYRCYTEKLSSTHHREAEIESHLRIALEKNELSLNYQPQYNLVTKEVVGAEVLIRWNSETLGQVSPEEFIPVAENSNLIGRIGNWVLYKVCEQATLWAEQYKRQLLFSINVSPIQFENNNFYTNFKKTVEEFNFPASNLSIEITENLIMKNNEIVSIGLKNIGALGSSISLDDFGMGYSSLSRLQLLPINTLKIDKFFVANIHSELDKVVVIDTIIKLAHELGMTVIAEGIETEAQLNYLISKNCYLGQGFLLNRPLSAEKFEEIAYFS